MHVYLAHVNVQQLVRLLPDVNLPYIFFIDLSNNTTIFYRSQQILDLYNWTLERQKYDRLFGLVLQQILDLLIAFPKSKVVIFYESGSSLYHRKINPEYKRARKYTSTMIPKDLMDNIQELIKIFKDLVERVIIQFPRTYVYHLKFMESDFIPYYFMHTVVGLKQKDNVYPIVFSSDKDMYQLFGYRYSRAQIRNTSKKFPIVTFKNFVHALTGKDYNISNFTIEQLRLCARILPHMLAICGDDSDNIKGIPRYGARTFFNHFLKVIAELESDTVKGFLQYDDIQLLKEFILPQHTYFQEHENLIEQNLKQTSFSVIYDNLPLNVLEQLDFYTKRSQDKPVSKSDFNTLVDELFIETKALKHNYNVLLESARGQKHAV